MSYIGNIPTNVAFLTDQFNGNGSLTAFTLSAAPANTNSILVAVSGVLQDPSTYSVSGTTLTFSAAPPAGTGNISVRFLGIPASGVTTTAYRTVTEFTATAGQTTFTPPSYTVGYINVYRNGALLGTADYTATNGTTVVLASAASSGDLVVVESFYVSSVLNAVPTTGGTFSGNVLFASGNGIWNTSGNVGIGTSSPTSGSQLDVVSTDSSQQFVNVLKLKTTNTGDVHPAILFENNRNSVSNAFQISLNSGTTAGSSLLTFIAKDSGGTFNRVVDIENNGDFQFNSGYGSVATAYGCRAWVNFTGTGTVTINGSGNVSSISDIGTGHYGVNFTTSLPDTNYVVFMSADISGWTTGRMQMAGFNTGGYQIRFWNSSGTETDPPIVNSAAIR